MGNMSYCRFENTAGDLQDCRNALEELLVESKKEDALSKQYELPAAKRLVKLCQEIIEMVAEQANVSVEDLNHAQIDGVLNEANTAAETAEQEEEEV